MQHARPNLFHRLGDAWAALKGAPAYNAGYGGYGYGNTWYGREQDEPSLQEIGGWRTNSVAAICQRWIIDNYSEARPRVYRDAGGEKWEPVTPHELTSLLKRPNGREDYQRLFDLLLPDFFEGNCFLLKVRGSGGFGRPRELWRLPAYQVIPDYDDDGHIQQWVYTVKGRRQIYAADDVIHIPYGPEDPGRPGMGMGWLGCFLSELGSLKEGSKYSYWELRNHGTMGGIVCPDPGAGGMQKMTVDQRDELRADIQEKTTGRERGKILPFRAPTKFLPITTSPQDMALGTILDRPEDRIAAIFGLSAMVLHLTAGANAKTYANADVAEKAAYRDCLIPLHARFDSALTFGLLGDLGGAANEEVRHDYKGIAALQEDATEKAKRAVILVGKIGTQNECRQLVGWEKRPEKSADELPALPPPGMLKPGMPGQPPIESQGGAAAAGKRLPLLMQLKALVKSNPHHDPHNGQFSGGSGGIAAGAEEQPTKSQKAILAQQTSRRVGADVQRYSEEHCEPILAKGLKAEGVSAVSLRDNEPVDVMRSSGGKITDGVELKVMTENKNNKITMKADAMARKTAWMEENKADFHTVVFDDQKVFNAKGEGQHGSENDRAIYYRRGSGSFRVGGMYRCRDMAELRELLDKPAADLPKAAQPPKGYVGYKTLALASRNGRNYATT